MIQSSILLWQRTILDAQEKDSEHSVMLIMPISSDLQLRHFVNPYFQLVFNIHWGAGFASLLYLVVGMPVLCLASRPHHCNEFHSLTLFVSSEPDVGLFHLMSLSCFYTHLFLGTPEKHICEAFWRGWWMNSQKVWDAEDLSTGRLNQRVSWGWILPQNKSWGWRSRSLHRMKESQNRINSVPAPNIQVSWCWGGRSLTRVVTSGDSTLGDFQRKCK